MRNASRFAVALVAVLVLGLIAWRIQAGGGRAWRVVERAVDDVGDGIEDLVEHEFEDPAISPFEDVEWRAGKNPRVLVRGVWHELLGVNGWEIDRLLEHIAEKYGRDKIEKRFEEDLPMVLREAGRGKGLETTLKLRAGDGTEAEKKVLMTEANRRRLWKKRFDAEAAAAPAPGVDGRKALEGFRTLLTTKHSYTAALGETKALAVVDVALVSGRVLDLAAAAEVAAAALGATVDGHAEVTQPRLPDGASIQALFVALDDSPGGVVVALKPDRSGFIDAERPRVRAIGGVPIETCLERAGRYVPDGSPALVRERACRLLRRGPIIGVSAGPVPMTLSRLDGTDERAASVEVGEHVPTYGEWPRGASRVLDGNVGYLRLATMVDDPKFLAGLRSRLEEFKECRGLVVDVRGNSGGSRDAWRLLASMVMKPDAEPLVYNAARPLVMGETPKDVDERMESRHLRRADDAAWNAAERAAIERFAAAFKPTGAALDDAVFGPWYYGVLSPDAKASWWREGRRVVVLMDHRCFSATDIFLVAMKEIEGVTLVGRPSAGGSGLAIAHGQAGGALRVRLSSMVSYQPDGALLDGVGVTPDVAVFPRAQDFLEGGSDSVLDRALREFE